MSTRRSIAALAMTILVYGSATLLQAQLPKQGTFSGKFGWVGSGSAYEMDTRTFFVGSFTGPFTNDAGAGFLHNSAWVCPGVNDLVSGVTVAAHGYCIVTDADGDKVFESWYGKGSAPGKGTGQFTWTGGTGKYHGITGGGTFEYTFIGTTSQGFSLAKGTWQLP